MTSMKEGETSYKQERGVLKNISSEVFEDGPEPFQLKH